jgi:hypothetical protein
MLAGKYALQILVAFQAVIKVNLKNLLSSGGKATVVNIWALLLS